MQITNNVTWHGWLSADCNWRLNFLTPRQRSPGELPRTFAVPCCSCLVFNLKSIKQNCHAHLNNILVRFLPPYMTIWCYQTLIQNSLSKGQNYFYLSCFFCKIPCVHFKLHFSSKYADKENLAVSSPFWAIMFLVFLVKTDLQAIMCWKVQNWA